MKFLGRIILVIALSFYFCSLGAQPIKDYRFDKTTIISSSISAVSGALWGGREAYHADPYVFENKFGAKEASFWGSDAWKRNYYGLDPANKHKPNYLNWTRDWWHFSGTASRFTMTLSVSISYTSKKGVWHQTIDSIISSAVFSIAAWATYTQLR